MQKFGLSVETADYGSIGGMVPVMSARAVLEQDRQEAANRAQAAAQQPAVQELVRHVRGHWEQARNAKADVEKRMMSAMRSLRGEYDPEVLAQINQHNGSTIYMMLFATKARQAKALLGDVLLGLADDKPWTLRPTPEPQLPPDIQESILAQAAQTALEAENSPTPMSLDEVRQVIRDAKMQAEEQIMAEARVRCARAEKKIEDILVEGGFIEALDEFLDDMMMYPTAFIKGPVVRNRGTLKWEAQPDGTYQPVVSTEPTPHWERKDARDIYPAPWSRSVQDGYLFDRHRLSVQDLAEMRGVPGYDDDAISEVIQQVGEGRLGSWITQTLDSAHDEAEGRTYTSMEHAERVDALQYWGHITGRMLLDWGMPAEEVEDPASVYAVELWLIDRWVIKASIVQDPLQRRPYYAASFKRVPGAFWNLSLYDTMRDCQDMCNAAARALSNNMGISSGPQVWLNIDRLPTNEDVTEMYPWKITQTVSDPTGSNAPPMDFFQPSSNANELLGVFDNFSQKADEYTGIPRYMTGDGSAGGAGRTASGMSMMVGNAGKTIKSLVSSIDLGVISPVVERGYEFVMRYIGDPDVKGDLQVVARGALSLTTKDAAQIRRNEFLTLALQSPAVQELIGPEGVASLLRSTTRTLDLASEDIVPSTTAIRAKMAQQQQQAMQMMQMQAQQGQTGGQPQGPTASAELANGAPVVDNFGA